jgi:beta-lactamase superfamily II metal-dependent hydrolase
MWLMMKISVMVTQWPGAFFYVRSPAVADFVIYYGALIAVLSGFALAPKRRVWTAICLVGIAGFYFWRWHDADRATNLTVIPLNGGSAVYCDTAGSRDDLLVDCGNGNAVKFVTEPFLHAQGVNRLPCLALTHGDLRRVGGAGLLRTLLPVGQIAIGPTPFRSPAYRQIVESLQSTPERRRIVQQGDRLGEWTVLHPQSADRFPQADDNALVLRGEFSGTRVLLVSDLGRQGQYALLDRTRDLRADIVVSGLPEQGEPLGDMLLEAIQPKLIVITDSEFPATKRARPELRARLERRGIPVLYTRTAGAVTIALKKNHWQASAMDGRVLTGASDAAR